MSSAARGCVNSTKAPPTASAAWPAQAASWVFSAGFTRSFSKMRMSASSASSRLSPVRLDTRFFCEIHGLEVWSTHLSLLPLLPQSSVESPVVAPRCPNPSSGWEQLVLAPWAGLALLRSASFSHAPAAAGTAPRHGHLHQLLPFPRSHRPGGVRCGHRERCVLTRV